MSDHQQNGGYGHQRMPMPLPEPKASIASALRPEHPVLREAFDAIAALRSLTVAGPADAALLLQGLVGDGTGGPSLVEQIAKTIVQVASQVAVDLAPVDGAEAVYAARLAEITLTGVAGDQLATAITILEDAATAAAGGTWRCEACDTFNADFDRVCRVCDTPRGGANAALVLAGAR